MNGNNCHKYDDIINLPRHISKKHPQMPAISRAAQFSPFAALTGHGEAIQETQRLTENFIELNEDMVNQLDRQLQFLHAHILEHPKITVTYFRPDEKKDGGTYVTIQGMAEKIDTYGRRLLLADGTAIPIASLYSMELEDTKETIV